MKRYSFAVNKVFAAVFGVFVLFAVLGCPNQFMKKLLGSNKENPLPPVTVIFDKNGGDTEANPIITALQKGAAASALPTPPKRAGYAFTGWNTNKDGTGSTFYVTTPVNESLTVYAQWMFDPAAFFLGGTGPGGGIIFYIADGSPGKEPFTFYRDATDTVGITCCYLEAAPEDMPSTLAWGVGSPASDTLVPGLSINFADNTDRAIGRGKKNTALILAYITNPAAEVPAAHACNTYTSPTGKDDWFLPSRNELNQLYQNKSFVLGLDTSTSGLYWTSSQGNETYVSYQRFSDGSQNDGTKSNGTMLYVRAIRAF